MARHKQFAIATDMAVYFCDPASPWQRGTNENTNGLLRQYFPKGTDLSVYGPEDLEHVSRGLFVCAGLVGVSDFLASAASRRRCRADRLPGARRSLPKCRGSR